MNGTPLWTANGLFVRALSGAHQITCDRDAKTIVSWSEGSGSPDNDIYAVRVTAAGN